MTDRDPMRAALVKRAESVMHLLCESGCEGRCQECPADVMRDMIAALNSPTPTKEETR